MPDDVLLVERDGHVAVLTMNRPHARNALDTALLKRLPEALADVAADASVRAIVLTGAGHAFCAGADLKAAMSRGSSAFDAIDTTIDEYHAIIHAITSAPKPVIAAVDGAAVGFGCDLALSCDLRVMSTDGYLQEKFVKIGLMPDGGGTFWLPRLIGLGRAMEMLLFGESVPAEKAVAMGLANRVVPVAQLRDEAMTMARTLAKGPPIAFAEMKRAVRASLDGTVDSALALEKKGQLRCLASADCMEGIMAWMEKREPTFAGK